jgi:beta-lactamase regulating signal transducer with metallopeptidase domain/protocatechuate 3,4-dioxygenase beta subunit/thiol-disulfide isomerase/thioredoxin
MGDLLDRVPATLVAPATVWLALGLAAAWLVRRRPARAHSLLTLAVAGALTTPLLVLAVQRADWGVLPARVLPAPTRVNPSASLVIDPRPALHRRLAPLAPHDGRDVMSVHVAAPVRSLPASPAPRSEFPWRRAALSFWLILSVILLVRLIADFAMGWRMVRQGTAVTDASLLRALHGAATRLAAPPPQPELRATRAIASPALWGWSRPATILIPEARGFPGDCEAVFCHEIAHLGRRDHWTALLAELLVCALPWHPLGWLARRWMSRYAEEACDDWAVACGCPPLEFAETLVGLAPTATPALTVAAVSRHSLLAARVRRLLTEGFRRPRLGRAWLAGIILAAVLLAAGWAVCQPRHATAEPPAPDATAQPAAPRTMRVAVLDPHGKPLSGAKIHAGIWTEEKGFKANRDYETDAMGLAHVELPKTLTILRLWAGKEPLVRMFANWEQNELATIRRLPDSYTFRLEPAVSAGGRIVDEQGQPIRGARVQVMLANEPRPRGGDGRVSYDVWLATQDDAARTDAEGGWRIDNVPNDPRVELRLLVTHPDHESDLMWGQAQFAAGVTTAMLLKGTARLRLKGGVIVRGRVTDPTGKPVAGALVVQGDDPYFASTPSEFPTDGDGRFQLSALPQGERNLTVVAAGWAPQMRRVNLQPGLLPQDFRLEPGKPVRLRIVDGARKPIPGAQVSIAGWKGIKSLHNHNHPNVHDTKVPRQTDGDGIWEWTWAPDDPVKLQVHAKGFTSSGLEIGPGQSPHTIVLKVEHRITGRVTDALTGDPIRDFTVIPVDVFRKDFLHAERQNAVLGKDGRLDYLAQRTDIALRLRVEAEGYRTQDGPEFRMGEDAARTQSFRLLPGRRLTGTVVDAGGHPVTTATVLLATPTQEAKLSSEWDNSLSGNHKRSTEASGRFAFPDPGEFWGVLVQADGGYAFAEFPAGQHDAGTLTLKPWAAVRGRFLDGGRPIRGALILLLPIRIGGLGRPRIDVTLQTVTSADGSFEFPRVPPIPVSVRAYLGPWKDEGYRSGPSVPLDLQPGQRAELEMGSDGATLTGKVSLAGKVPADLDCTYSLNFLVRREPGIAPPLEVARLGFNVRNGWRPEWRESNEGVAYLGTLRYWFVKLAPDGSFRISGVPPGKYDLSIEVYAKPSGCLVDPLARRVLGVTVTAADVARGTLSLPEVEAPVVPVPAVGDTPVLTFHRPDGTTGNLTEYRGRHVVVHFWASWCGPCKQQFPAVGQLHERFTARGLAMLGLSVDDDQAAWQTALAALELPWKHGRVGAAEAGVSSVPAYWLLDPDGRIVEKVLDPDELTATLTDRLK